ncbi:hypothetical protein AB0P15_22805 [Streptomyces sp. NPDC087917]|uniref:hypothetical protein n=1 Tax=Streptomyces sp. NPDC087917 TaxID=3155060 RepID=UPI003439B75D
MSEHLIPPQPGDVPRPVASDGRLPVHPALSESGRLLCAGTYLDAPYRDRVIDELFVHEERIAAPSYGFDATRVLAHALRARRIEIAWAAAILGAWFIGSLLTGGTLAALLVPFLLFSLSRWLRRRESGPARFLGVVVLIATWVMLLLVVIGLWAYLAAASWDLVEFGRLLSGDDGRYGGYGSDSVYGGSAYGDGDGGAGTGALLWLLPAAFAGIVALVGLQRGHAARVIATQLSPDRYADRARDPAEASQGARFARVGARILGEQYAPLVMYNIGDPFCGAGEPFRPWQLSVELRPREGPDAGREPYPVTNAHIVERIVPLLHALRVPSPHGSPQAREAVLDRLRELVVDECVFLPAVGLPHRDSAPLGPEHFAAHRLGAIEEGGERRRHFLRVRVGGWDENLVVTVFVRVHTQGRMLMLEVAPHVLLPVRARFRDADADAHRLLHNNWFGTAASALAATPGSFLTAVTTLARGAASWWRIATGGHGGARPQGPRASVRKLGSSDEGSLFHLMDLDRYLKTVQDRVVGGVTVALHEAGWHTDEFARRAVHVAEGGVFIQSVNGSAFSVGGTGHDNTVRGGGTGSGKGSSGGK